MASKPKENETIGNKSNLKSEISAIIFILLAILLGIALYSSSLSGLLGQYIHDFLLGIFGPSIFISPIFLAYIGIKILINKQYHFEEKKILHILIIVFVLSALYQSIVYTKAEFEKHLAYYIDTIYLKNRRSNKIEAVKMLQFIYKGSISPTFVYELNKFPFGGVIGSSISLGISNLIGDLANCVFLSFSFFIELIILFDFSLSNFYLKCKKAFHVLWVKFTVKKNEQKGDNQADKDSIEDRIKEKSSSVSITEESINSENKHKVIFKNKRFNTLSKLNILDRIKGRGFSRVMASNNNFPFFTFDESDKHRIIKQKRPKSSGILGFEDIELVNKNKRERRINKKDRHQVIRNNIENNFKKLASQSLNNNYEEKLPRFLNQEDIINKVNVPNGKTLPQFLKDLDESIPEDNSSRVDLNQYSNNNLSELLISNKENKENERTVDFSEFKNLAQRNSRDSNDQVLRDNLQKMFQDFAVNVSQKQENYACEAVSSNSNNSIEANEELSPLENFNDRVTTTADEELLQASNVQQQFGNIFEINQQDYFEDAVPDYLKNNSSMLEDDYFLTGDGVLSEDEKRRALLEYQNRIADKQINHKLDRQNKVDYSHNLHQTDETLTDEDSSDEKFIDEKLTEDNLANENLTYLVDKKVDSELDSDKKTKTIQKSGFINNLSKIQPSNENNVINNEISHNNKGLVFYDKPYIFPPLSLLSPANHNSRANRAEIEHMAVKLVELLKSFGVETKLSNITSGPTITRFELTPGVGVRVNKILNLSEDIALGLAATGIRIEAPIPGRSAVGIEIPNRVKETVYLRPLLEEKVFTENKSKLAAPIGRDIPGEAIICDISKMPHLLVAGATGSGKSVCINAILISLLFRATPKDLRLILIDPKVVELSLYNGIPHLLTPVVTDPQKAANTLNWAVQEMDRRYKLFAKSNCKDIARYNLHIDKKVKDKQAERNDMYARAKRNDPLKSDKEIRELINASLPLPADEKLPLILIVIDELADLMAAAHQDVETSIARLTAKARAAGMHLIIATQRPSVDVITGTIKANTPSRLAFAVSSQVDSRTILDRNGAESLLGKGDMLYHPLTENKAKRGQAALVSDAEAEAVVEFIKANNCSELNEELSEEIQGASSNVSNANSVKDELYEEAIEVILEVGSASASVLQRRLNIGYPRAARLIDTLEDDHIIGPHEGSKPRKLKITRAEWDEIKANFNE